MPETFGLAEHLRRQQEERDRRDSLHARQISGLEAKVRELAVAEARAQQTIRNLERENETLNRLLAEARSRP